MESAVSMSQEKQTALVMPVIHAQQQCW